MSSPALVRLSGGRLYLHRTARVSEHSNGIESPEPIEQARQSGLALTAAVAGLVGLCGAVILVTTWIFANKVQDNVQAQINALRAELFSGAALVTRYEYNSQVKRSDEAHDAANRALSKLESRLDNDERDLRELRSQLDRNGKR